MTKFEQNLIAKYQNSKALFKIPFASNAVASDLSIIDSIDSAITNAISTIPNDDLFTYLISTGISWSRAAQLNPNTNSGAGFGGDPNISAIMQDSMINSFRLSGRALLCRLYRTNEVRSTIPTPSNLANYMALYKSGGFSGGIGFDRQLIVEKTTPIFFGGTVVSPQSHQIVESELFLFTPLHALLYQNYQSFGEFNTQQSLDVYAVIPSCEWVDVDASKESPQAAKRMRDKIRGMNVKGDSFNKSGHTNEF